MRIKAPEPWHFEEKDENTFEIVASDNSYVGETCSESMAEKIVSLANKEKQRRIYYQNIVYEVCDIIDANRGDKNKTVCGTIESPSSEVQSTLRNLLANHEPKF